MATYYVHGQSGSDANDGLTTSTPFLTLAKLVAVFTSGDTAYLAGTFRPAGATNLRTDLSNITIAAWPGQTAPVIRGDTLITGWAGAAGVFTKTLATGLNIKSVVVDWDASIDSSGRHYGHLTLGANAAACTADSNKWFYDGATGVMTIGIGAGEDPATLTIGWCVGGVNGLSLGGSGATVTRNIVVSGLTFYLWTDKTGELGYGLRMYNTVGSRMANITVIDCGYHGTGWTHYGASGAITENLENNTLVMGVSAGGDTAGVMYSESENMSRCGFLGCVAHLYPKLGRDGAPIAVSGVTTYSVTGFAFHAEGSNTNIIDCTASNCDIYHYATTGFTLRSGGFTGANTPVPTDKWDWTTYAVRFIRCRIFNGVRQLVTYSTAYVWCKFQMGRAGSSDAASTGAATLGTATSNVTAGACIGYFGCEVVANLDPTTAGTSYLFRLYEPASSATPASQLILLNCAVLNSGVSVAANVRGLLAPSGDLVIFRARGCIFGHYTAVGGGNLNHLFHGDTLMAVGDHDFADNLYLNIASTRYSSLAAIDTLAEYTASVDPNGVYTTINPFTDADGSDGLDTNYAGRARKPLSIMSLPVGINGASYSGDYGAWQHGANSRSGGATGNGRIGVAGARGRGWAVR